VTFWAGKHVTRQARELWQAVRGHKAALIQAIDEPTDPAIVKLAQMSPVRRLSGRRFTGVCECVGRQVWIKPWPRRSSGDPISSFLPHPRLLSNVERR